MASLEQIMVNHKIDQEQVYVAFRNNKLIKNVIQTSHMGTKHLIWEPNISYGNQTSHSGTELLYELTLL